MPEAPDRPVGSSPHTGVQWPEDDHVLIIDDEEVICRYCVRILERAGAVCSAAATRKQALELLEADSKIRVAVIDYQMPGVNVKELVFDLKRIRPTISIVGHSAVAGPEEYAAVGVSRVCRKGWTVQELLSVLQQ